MADKTIDTNLNVTGTVEAITVQENGVPVVVSSSVDDILSVSQAAYDALGPGRPSNRLYLITE